MSLSSGCVGADSYTLALYNLPGPPPTYKSISKKAAAPNQNLYDMDPNEEKEERKRRRRRSGVEEEEKKIRTVVELSVQPQALAPLLVRVLAHKNSAYSSRSVT